MNAPRRQRQAIDGWVALDKPVGVTSTAAVGRLKRIFNAQKAGHAGTLDPLASGLLPVAFGEATKTVPFVQDGEKAYRFTVVWGAETDTDDLEGVVVQTCGQRPAPAEIERQLPNFLGEIWQVPPQYSAIKIGGERAYDLARAGEAPQMTPRRVIVHALRLAEAARDFAVFETECGKGTYVRAMARDLGRALGCGAHVGALRRTRVGSFREQDAVGFDALDENGGAGEWAMLPVAAGLREMQALAVDRDAAGRLRRGQAILLRGRDAPAAGFAYALCGGVPIAVGSIEAGELTPTRVFNLAY